MKEKYEQSLQHTSWVVTQVTELDGRVSRLQERYLVITRELGMNVAGCRLRQTAESGTAPPRPGSLIRCKSSAHHLEPRAN